MADVEGDSQCRGSVMRSAPGGTFVVVPDPGSSDDCGCTLLTGNAAEQSTALERRVRAWESKPSCDVPLGLATTSADGQPVFRPGMAFGGAETDYGKLAPALLGLAFGADKARRGNRPDSPGG